MTRTRLTPSGTKIRKGQPVYLSDGHNPDDPPEWVTDTVLPVPADYLPSSHPGHTIVAREEWVRSDRSPNPYHPAQQPELHDRAERWRRKVWFCERYDRLTPTKAAQAKSVAGVVFAGFYGLMMLALVGFILYSGALVLITLFAIAALIGVIKFAIRA